MIALVFALVCSVRLQPDQGPPKGGHHIGGHYIQDGQQATAEKAPKKAKNGKAKDPNAPKKPKKAKKAKAPESDAPPAPSPDEPLKDDDGQPRPAGRPAHFVWRQHPSVRFGRALRIDFQAKFQEDGRSSYEGARLNADLQPWELHRSRIGVQGTLFRHIDFEVERELTERELTEREVLEGQTKLTPWKDVNVNVDYIDNAQVQVGRFKIPFGLDQLTGISQNDFVYRSLGASYLAPARDTGVMVHGRFFKRGLGYWAGVFEHDGDNARSKKIQGGDETVAARVTAMPLRRLSAPAFEGFEIGTAATFTRVSDDSFRPNGLRGRTAVTQDHIFEPVYVKGDRLRWEADLDWMIGPASVRAEYTHVLDDRKQQGFRDEDLPRARYRAWYTAGTWLLTGEKKARPIRPGNDFLSGGGPGAIEVAARYERLWIDSVGGDDIPFANPRAVTILPSGDRAFTVGVNWILNRFAKLQVNAIRERIEDPGHSPVPNGSVFWSRLFRLQLVL